MKKIISISIILTMILTVFTSCEKSFDSDNSKNNREIQLSDVPEVKQEKTIEKTLARMFFNSLFISEDKINTRSLDSDFSIEPIRYKDTTVMWVANYPNNGGYVIISNDKTTFPIVSYSSEGNFNYNLLNAEYKESFDKRLEGYYQRITSADSIKKLSSLWLDLSKFQNQENGDTTYLVDIKFFDKPEENKESLSTKTEGHGGPRLIPERTYPINYQSIDPLLTYYNFKSIIYGIPPRAWTDRWPYNIDMPKNSVYNDKSAPLGQYVISIPSFVVCLTLVMDYLGLPDAGFWFGQPSSMPTSIRTGNELTRFIRTLSDDMGVQYMTTLSAKGLFDNSIPQILANKYGFKYNPAVQYTFDQSSFDELRYHLYNKWPAIIAWNVYDMNSHFTNVDIIDGVMEGTATVTIYTTIGGITIHKNQYQIYTDFIHLVSAYGRSNDKWETYFYYNFPGDINSARMLLPRPY